MSSVPRRSILEFSSARGNVCVFIEHIDMFPVISRSIMLVVESMGREDLTNQRTEKKHTRREIHWMGTERWSIRAMSSCLLADAKPVFTRVYFALGEL